MGKRKNKKKNKVVVDHSKAGAGKEVTDPIKKVSYHSQTIKFSTDLHDPNGDWGWGRICAHTFLRELFDKILNDFQSMTYAELISPKKSSHGIPLDDKKLNKQAMKRFEEMGLHEQYDELLSIRVAGKKRLWCVHDKNILHILWWDPEHKIYPSKKK